MSLDVAPLYGELKKPVTLYYCDALASLCYLLQNPLLADSQNFVPMCIWDGEGNRVYNEMWTRDWWWEAQVSTGTEGSPLV